MQTLLSVLFSFIIVSHLSASDSVVNWVGLPRDLVLEVVRISQPRDGHRFLSTCRGLHKYLKDVRESLLYRELGKDKDQALIWVQNPVLNIKTLMPSAISERVHSWYLAVHYNKLSTFRGFCYLFAAGRAGHLYAMEEAGKMLMNIEDANNPEHDVTDRVPALIILEDLIPIVPGFELSVVNGWDVFEEHRELIERRDVREVLAGYGDPMRAFLLQMDLLRHPDNIEFYITAQQFYDTLIVLPQTTRKINYLRRAMLWSLQEQLMNPDSDNEDEGELNFALVPENDEFAPEN